MLMIWHTSYIRSVKRNMMRKGGATRTISWSKSFGLMHGLTMILSRFFNDNGKNDLLPDMFSARARLRNNKMGGDDNLVPEMLKLLPPLMVYILYTYFWSRICGATIAPESWTMVLICWI